MKKYLSPTVFLCLLLIACNKDVAKKDLTPPSTNKPSCTNILDEWEITTNTYTAGIQRQNDLFFPSNDIGYSVGNAGSIMKTTDGGESWKVLEYYYLPEVGINAHKGVLLVTENNGMSWDVKNFPESGCNRLYFIDDQNGFASCGALFFPEKKYRTKDGGNSWAQIESPLNISSLIHFNTIDKGFVINPVIVYVEGGGELTPELQFYEIFQTTDGGINWNKTEIDKECDLTGVSYAASINTFYSLGNTANKFQVK